MILDYIMRWIVWNALDKAHVFKTLFLTPAGEWSENQAEGDWHKWHDLPDGALTCDVKYESYWIIGGRRYEDPHHLITDEAFQAMYDELFIKPAVVPVMEIIVDEFFKQE